MTLTDTVEGYRGAKLPWLRAAVCQLSIKTKRRGLVRLGDVINHAQEDFLAECERQLAETGQIRIVVLKARQIGISTIIEAIVFVLSMLFDGFNSLIVSHETESAQTILQMTKRYWATYPYRTMHMEQYNGKNQLAWADLDANIQVSTAKNVDKGRSKTLHALHASEVAFWQEGDVLMNALSNAIPDMGMTCIFLESTANGVGNYFHQQTMAAMRGDSDYTLRFYPWHKHPEYTSGSLPPAQRKKYALSPELLDEEERTLIRNYGVTLDQLAWRRYTIKNKCNGDVERFHQEHPSAIHEAFLATGRNAFSLTNMLPHYEPRRGQRGILTRGPRGKVVFQPHDQGWLTVYTFPSSDRDWGVYVAGGDPTHTTTGDNACVQVISRRTMEQCAVYRRKIDPINFGKHMQLIGAYYNNALLAPECEGPGYATVGCIVADYYPNVYKRTNITKQPGKPTGDLHGWSTNANTKELAISHLTKAFADPVVTIGEARYGLVIHDELTMMELRDYQRKETGLGFENGDGSDYDDGVMALAIALAVHNIESPPPPYVTPDPFDNLAVEIIDPRTPSGPVIESRVGAPEIILDTPAPDDPGPPAPPPWEAWGKKD